MERIRPPASFGVLMMKGKVVQDAVINELGVYGAHIGDGVTDYCNVACGHLLRTKLKDAVVGAFFVFHLPHTHTHLLHT